MAELLAPLLRQILRVTTKDDRIFLGTFAGTDQPLNLILVNAEEFRLVRAYPLPDRMEVIEEGVESAARPTRETEIGVENENGRYVGQILLPWKLITKVEVSAAAGLYSDSDDDDYT